MSITCVLVAVSPEQIGSLLANPATADDLVFPDDPDHEGFLDLDKTWHGIHFLLCQRGECGNPPLDSIGCGGTSLTDDGEWGYGPPRVLDPSDTTAFAEAVASLSDDDLKSRFDPPAMLAQKIYPEIWDRDPTEDDTLAWLMWNIPYLRAFLQTTANGNLGILIAFV